MTRFKNKTTDELKELYGHMKDSLSPATDIVKEELLARGVDISEAKPTAEKKTDTRPTFEYKASGAVSDIGKALSDHEKQKPAVWDTESEYSPVAKAYEKLKNREPFSYNVDADALYKQYRQKYTDAGKRAMEDAVGKASALTGGYGNSYAATVGNSAYGKYLSELDGVIPELYKIALGKYNDEGTRLENEYKLAKNAYDDRYGEYRNTLSDWEKEKKSLADAYESASSEDYKRYKDRYKNAVDEYEKRAKEEEKAKTEAAKTDAKQDTARTYKYSDYASVERRSAEFKGKPVLLKNFLDAMSGSGLISEAAAKELYERFKE